jgi:iron complex transport system substrate-binding protein
MDESGALADDLGRGIRLAEPARRIVSLVPSLTETFIGWGLRERLVGITDYCVLPKEDVRGLHRIGGTKNPRVEEIAALAPDLVIANAEENRREDVERLEALGAPSWVTFPKTVAQVPDMLRRLGAALGATDAAEEDARRIDAELALAQGASNPLVARGAGRRAVYLVWREPYMSVGADTYIHDVLVTLGFENVFASRAARYFEVAAGEIRDEAPDWLLLPSEPYPFSMRHARELALATGIGLERVKLLPGEDYCWFGCRTAHVFATHRRIFA